MAAGAAPSASDIYCVPTSVLYGNLIQMEDRLKQLGVSGIKPRIAMTSEEIISYLDKPPPGVSEHQWEQAKLHNPDPEKLAPVPMLGFEQLDTTHRHQRLLCNQQLA